jgi:hypothetical protein
LHQDNRSDFRFKAIDKVHCVLEGVCGCGIIGKLINKFSKLGYVSRDSGGVSNGKIVGE